MRNHALTVTADYTATDGTLTFTSGEETLTLGLSNPSEGQVTDGEATGTIENTDPLPRALLARFGRATALQVMEQVEERLEVSRAAGFRGRFAGRELRRGMERDMGRNFLSRLQSTAVQGARDTTGVQSDLSSGELLRTGLGGGDVLMGSGFVLNRETGGGGSVSRWSRGRESRFSGRDGELSLDGGVRAQARSRSAGPTSRGAPALDWGGLRPSRSAVRGASGTGIARGPHSLRWRARLGGAGVDAGSPPVGPAGCLGDRSGGDGGEFRRGLGDLAETGGAPFRGRPRRAGMVGGVTARYRPVAHTVRLLNLLSEGVGELGISLAATDRALHELDGAPAIGESGGAGDTVEAGRNSSQVQPRCAWP